MIKSLRDAQITDGLPRIVREQPWVKALSMAAAVLHKKTMDYIDGSQIYTAIDSVAEPVAVRYGWADNPECTLYNQAGLPASPFRTDTWPLESEGRTVTTFEFLGATPAQPPGGTPR